jgi:hypothetical protein
VNNVSVPAVGISNIEVGAKVSFINDTKMYTAEKVKVMIGLSMERLMDGNSTVTRLHVRERIMAIDGVSVSQPKVIGQIIDIKEDGTCDHHAPCPMDSIEPTPQAHKLEDDDTQGKLRMQLSHSVTKYPFPPITDCRVRRALAQMGVWLRTHSTLGQILLGGMAGFIFSCLCIGLYELVMAIYLRVSGRSRYEELPSYDTIDSKTAYPADVKEPLKSSQE